VIVIGLTGGIGAGKSIVASMLVERGAVLIDADVLAREVVAPGRPAHAKVIERFGDKVVSPDGSIDRPALAAEVFNDKAALRDLEAIIHPEVRAEIAARLAAEASGDRVVVLEVPLLVEGGDLGSYGLAGVIVIDAPEDIALERLVTTRHMERSDAEARIANQVERAERIAKADFVILNVGTLEELEEMVNRAWDWMGRLGAKGGNGSALSTGGGGR
jgi:dephospho-CoA kinase